MRYLYLLILLTLLLDSCSITKRKYLPGYSINWNHKAPKTIISGSFVSSRNNYYNHSSATIAANPPELIQEKQTVNTDVPITPKHSNIFRFVKKASTISSSQSLTSPTSSKENSSVEPPPSHSDKEVCKQSKVSMHSGMYSLSVTFFTLMIGLILIVARNSGALWVSASLASGVIIGGAISGGALGILALVFGIIAIHKINKESDVLTGKGKAVTGMVFASILLGILALVA